MSHAKSASHFISHIIIHLILIIMKKHLRLEKRRPVFRILCRLLVHSKTYEEMEYLWKLQLNLLTEEERRFWLIHVFSEYKFSLPHQFPNKW